MNILMVSQYFPPEPGAPSNRVSAFVEAMVRRGHRVTVVCEFPCYPTGILRKADKWKLFRREKRDGYTVVNTYVMTFPVKNNIKRMLYYISFAVSSFFAVILLRRHDVVMVSSPPIFFAYSSMIAALIKRSRFIVDIRDLWPDTAKEVEAVSSGRLMKWGAFLERGLYKNATRIFTVSEGIKSKIEQRGGKDKTSIVYNGSFEEILRWQGSVAQVRERYGWTNKIVITYAGIIGLGQDILAALPQITKVRRDDIEFVFIGDGPQKADLVSGFKREGFKNVRFFEAMSQAEVIPYLYASDVLMVILREIPFFNSAIPSKFFDSMAVGKPIITNVDGELRKIMENNQTGLYFSWRIDGSFAEAVTTLASSPELRKKMGENGKILVADRYLRSIIAERAVKIIEESRL
jgi:glycosyltransferase involved in cell wall biosynthesis